MTSENVFVVSFKTAFGAPWLTQGVYSNEEFAKQMLETFQRGSSNCEMKIDILPVSSLPEVDIKVLKENEEVIKKRLLKAVS